ncbi:MAG TPA: hypothetical protein VFZ91_14990 [Allosphingosinicella sp.]
MKPYRRSIALSLLAASAFPSPAAAQTSAEHQLMQSTFTRLFPRHRPRARLLPDSFRIVQSMGEGYLTLSSGREVHAKAFKVYYGYTNEPPGAPVNRSNNIFDPTLGALPHRQYADFYFYWDYPNRILCIH